jgi:hypothetical protein
MIKRKSRSKKNTNEKELKKNDLLEEIGTINGFAIIEKSSKDNEEDKKEKEETKKEEDLEMKGELIDLSNFDDKNKSFFKNWIVYDNPKESRFTKLFKELEVEDNKNDIYQINADTEQYQGETNSAFDNISRDPSEENSRDSRASYENFNIITEETLKDTIKEEKKEKKDDKELEKNEIKEIKENKEEELNLTLEINDIISQKDKRSTIMIKNIPNKFNQEYILNIINQNFKGTFDVFVLPTDINKFKNFGYAFINFTSSYYIPYFYFMFNGNMWFGTNSQKICELAYSKVQGKEALLDHYPSKIVFCNEEALEVTPEQKYIIPNIYKLYFNECFPKEKIEEYKYYFITKMPSL